MTAPRLSIVVPTYQEAENIPLLAAHIAEALAGESFEIIIADDFSGDNTDEVCKKLADDLPLRLLTRHDNRGLAAAVIDGIALARGEFIVVMDADLSHPPDKIADMIAPLAAGEADFAVGSRYVRGGELGDDWSWLRKLNSYGATVLARPLTLLADPMSGFFALRRADMPAAENLSPIGYKIGLEIAVKAGWPHSRIHEVPIHFQDRQLGESKMTLREQINYVRHLRRLYHYRWPRPMEVLQFCAVGGTGFVLDVAIYYLLLMLGMPHLWARGLAFWPAVSTNWFLNRIMTFKTRPREMAAAQWLRFVLVCLVGFVLNWGTYALLTTKTEFFMEHRLAALVLGVLVGTVFNFVSSDWLVFRRADSPTR